VNCSRSVYRMSWVDARRRGLVQEDAEERPGRPTQFDESRRWHLAAPNRHQPHPPPNCLTALENSQRRRADRVGLTSSDPTAELVGDTEVDGAEPLTTRQARSGMISSTIVSTRESVGGRRGGPAHLSTRQRRCCYARSAAVEGRRVADADRRPYGRRHTADAAVRGATRRPRTVRHRLVAPDSRKPQTGEALTRRVRGRNDITGWSSGSRRGDLGDAALVGWYRTAASSS